MFGNAFGMLSGTTPKHNAKQSKLLTRPNIQSMERTNATRAMGQSNMKRLKRLYESEDWQRFLREGPEALKSQFKLDHRVPDELVVYQLMDVCDMGLTQMNSICLIKVAGDAAQLLPLLQEQLLVTEARANQMQHVLTNGRYFETVSDASVHCVAQLMPKLQMLGREQYSANVAAVQTLPALIRECRNAKWLLVDIKASNFGIYEDRIVLTDLDAVVRYADPKLIPFTTGRFTKGCSAPECATATALTLAADVYGFAAMLLELGSPHSLLQPFLIADPDQRGGMDDLISLLESAGYSDLFKRQSKRKSAVAAVRVAKKSTNVQPVGSSAGANLMVMNTAPRKCS
eukprot:TRINITY_DN2294_c0_g1_i1.p1 TRINITY_DN2294_c0_g1~~TRINITY_DN2294_c0_g1_i1.p1  ORF type:complete len:344 (-),score=55.16 TRINITY_DN2294_c0_g1_i1:92-1123(-)